MSAFYDHTRHKLDIHDLDAHLDVLAFEGEEQLSQPFKYIIEFTCTEQDIAAAQVLGKFADFTLHNPPVKPAWGTPEWRNVNAPEGLLRALFDDQVHDSRAWFLYAFNLKQVSKGGREPGGSYLRERMVFFGNTNSRKLALYDANDQLVLAGDPRLHGLEQRLPEQPEPMTAERMAQAQKAIADRWEAYYAQASEVNDASV
jgi:hypothetical protein